MNKPAIDYFNDRADALAAQYNQLDRRKVHADLLANLPAGEALRVLDIGAGSGADANMFAKLGYQVVATEPADKLRDIGIKTFPDKNIEWNADVLPQLPMVTGQGKTFDIVSAIGVLQYLDEDNRRKSLKTIFSLVAVGGVVDIQYPVPASREHQFTIGKNEIADFVQAFNQVAGATSEFSIVIDKEIPDHTGRKALDGSDLFFKTMVLRRIR
ncbi:MAG: class SAM-dependent methyltransferase [Alphaproteobacteria bacterium]|jgi:cyclopropane fatty-acyl-phospholipid synthase-like methyltransferase|nr:class SAM-dependent methyltransferase [Alphaproteobacteria bacterium]